MAADSPFWERHKRECAGVVRAAKGEVGTMLKPEVVREEPEEVVHEVKTPGRSEVSRRGWSPERRTRQAESMKQRWRDKRARAGPPPKAKAAKGVGTIPAPSPARGPPPALLSVETFTTIAGELRALEARLEPLGLRVLIGGNGWRP